MKEELSPERWKQIDQLLDSILELDPQERNAFLENALAGDEELKKQIESLLQSYDEATNLIEAPAFQAAAELITHSAISPGQAIGRYTILSSIGTGGMGEVYRAMDPLIGREVAIKILPTHFSQDEERLRRFEQEARAAGMLNHPNIVAIYDVGRDNGYPYLVTELLEGQTLRQILEEDRISITNKIEYAVQIVKGLSSAHEKGIVHRDLKPENLFVTKGGLVKILDFGLAKLTESSKVPRSASDRSKTQKGMVLGTAVYMSPEQIRGGKIDYRSDIFSFGSVLYEMIAGQSPFQGETEADVMSAVLKSDPPPLTHSSSELDLIVRRCLEKEPDRRFQSTNDLAFALEALLPSLHSTTLRKKTWGRNITRGLALTGALILFMILFFASRERTPPIKSKKLEPFQKMKIARLTTSGKISDAAISPDGKYVSYVMKEGDAQSLWVRQVATTSNVQILAPSNVRFQGVTFSKDDNFIYYVISPQESPRGAAYQIPVLGGLTRKLLEDVYSPIAISPDNKSLTFVSSSALMISDMDGHDLRTLTKPKPGIAYGGSPSWSPDGKKIAVVLEDTAGYQDQLIAIDVDTQKESVITSTKWFDIQRLTWLSDGTGLVLIAKEEGSGNRNYQTWHISYPDGEASRITNDLSDYRGLSATSDSKTVITVRLEQTSNIWVLGERNSEARQITSGTGSLDGLWGVSWTPDGKILYTSTASGNEDIWLMSRDGANTKQLTMNSMAKIAPSCCSDGRYAVFMSRSAGGTHIWRIGMDGSDLKQLTDGSSEGVPNCGGDGRWIFYVSSGAGKWNLWKVSIHGGNPIQLTERPSLSPVVSPDGKIIAYSFLDEQRRKNIGILSTTGGSPIRMLPVSSTVLIDVGIGLRWMNDGKAIVYADTINGISNLWLQPLEGGPAKQLTNFESDEIFSFDISSNGEIAVSRGSLARDVVMISDFR